MAVQPSLCQTWLETSEDRFCPDAAHFIIFPNHYRDKERRGRSRSRSRSPDRESDRFIAKEKKRLEDLRLKIDKAKLREIAM